MIVVFKYLLCLYSKGELSQTIARQLATIYNNNNHFPVLADISPVQ